MSICQGCRPVTTDAITGADIFSCEVEPYNCPQWDAIGMMSCLRKAYPWARYLARNDVGKLSVHEGRPYYVNGGMRPTKEHYIELPSEFFPSIKRGECMAL